MMIRKSVMESMILHAERDAPIEACGCLAGQEGVVTRHYPMVNADGREDHFSFDTREQFAVYRAARGEGLNVLAVYHSHPATPARPSPEDLRLARDPDVVYVIVSLLGGSRSVRGYRVRQGAVQEVPLTIEEDA